MTMIMTVLVVNLLMVLMMVYIWCQSANTGSMIGTWYLPDGTQVPTADIDSPINIPLFAYHVTGQIGLLRDGEITGIGLYSCVIPDENGINQTLWVAAYDCSDFDSNGKAVLNYELYFIL